MWLGLTKTQAGALFEVEDIDIGCEYNIQYITIAEGRQAILNMIEYGEPRWTEVLKDNELFWKESEWEESHNGS